LTNTVLPTSCKRPVRLPGHITFFAFAVRSDFYRFAVEIIAAEERSGPQFRKGGFATKSLGTAPV